MNCFYKCYNLIISTNTFLFDKSVKSIQLAILLIVKKKVIIRFLCSIFGFYRDKASLELTILLFINTIIHETLIYKAQILYNLTEEKLNL